MEVEKGGLLPTQRQHEKNEASKPCFCSENNFWQSLFPLNGPSPPFLPTHVGDESQTITLADQITEACRLHGGTSMCSQTQFKFTDIETLQEISASRYKGLTWDASTNELTLHAQKEDPTGWHKVLLTTYHPSLKVGLQTVEIQYSITSAPSRQLKLYEQDDEEKPAQDTNQPRQLPTAGQAYCINSPSMLNLFNTGALAEQSSFANQHCNTAVAGCDGDIVMAASLIITPPYCIPLAPSAPSIWNTNAILATYQGGTNLVPEYWKVTFTQVTSIRSTLLILRDDGQHFGSVTVGNDPDVTINPSCFPFDIMTDGGWYLCPTSMAGTVFGIYSTNNYVSFMEAMAYSQEAIQMNSGATVSFIGTNDPVYPITNALQNIVVLLYSDTISIRQKCVKGTPPAIGFATFSIKFKAQVFINGVALLPAYDTANPATPAIIALSTNVAIYGMTIGGTQQLCGVLADYYTKYSEASCSIQANEIIVQQQTAGNDLFFCGFGALADCDCRTSSFNAALFTTTPATKFASTISLAVKSTDSVQSIVFNSQIPDTISSVCGLVDGITKCGLREIYFKDKGTGLLITVWPFYGYNWSAATSVLTLDPTQAQAKSVITATLSMVNFQNVIWSQDITTSVQGGLKIPDVPLFVSTQTMNAIIGQQSILFLPKNIGAQYSFISKPNFDVFIDGNQLKVISISNSDIGTYMLQMRAATSNQTCDFTVKVIFKDETNSTTTATKSTTSGQTSNATTQNTTEEISLNNSVISVQEAETLLATVKCTIDDTGIISCTSAEGFSYIMDAATGQLIRSDSNKTSAILKTANSPAKPPRLSISKVSSQGQFFLKFTQPMNLEALLNTTEDSIKAVNDTSDRYKYFLSPKHLLIKIKSANTTLPKFTWYAKNIKSTEIVIQLVFQDPLYISNVGVDKLVIKILPPALPYFKSIATRALTENPLQTVIRDLPPQVILGRATVAVSMAAESIEDLGKYSTLSNVAIQLALSGSMAQMWSMVNAQQIIMTYQRLNLKMPGNVVMVMTNLANICDFNVFPTDDIMSFLFNFTLTDPPGAGFETMENDSKSLTLYLGSSFLIMILILLQYLFYSLVYGLRSYHRLFNWIEQKLRPGLIFGTLYLFLIESYLDWAIGSALRLEQPEFQTPSDYFDFGLACAGILITLVLPFYCFFFLRKNINLLDNKDFKSKHGSIYDGFATDNALKRQATTKMVGWFLLRRFLTAVNLVSLRDYTIWIQLTLNMGLSLLDVCIKIELSPYQSKVGGFMDKFNDLFVMTCAYFPYLFTDLIPSQEDRYYIGWYYNGIIGLLITANLVVMMMNAYQNLKKWITIKVRLWKHKKTTETQNKKRTMQKEAMLKAKQNIDTMDEQEMFEQFKAYKRLKRTQARELALLNKVSNELKEIEEVQELSSIESELQNKDLRVKARNRNQVVPGTQREDQRIVDMTFAAKEQEDLVSQISSDYIQSLNSQEFTSNQASASISKPKDRGDSQFVVDSLVDLKVKELSFFEKQMAKYNQMLTDRQNNLIEEKQKKDLIARNKEFRARINEQNHEIQGLQMTMLQQKTITSGILMQIKDLSSKVDQQKTARKVSEEQKTIQQALSMNNGRQNGRLIEAKRFKK